MAVSFTRLIVITTTAIAVFVLSHTEIGTCVYYALKVAVKYHPTLDSSIDSDTVLRWASRDGDGMLVRYCLGNHEIVPSTENNYPIRISSAMGYFEIVKLLLGHRKVDPSVNHNEALISAMDGKYNQDTRYNCWVNHAKVVEILLEDPRVDPSDQNNLAIKLAARNGDYPVVDSLLQDERVDPTVDNNYPIGIAAKYRHCRVVRLLLQDGRADWYGNQEVRMASWDCFN